MLHIKNNTAKLIILRDKKLGQVYLLPGSHINECDDSWKNSTWLKLLVKDEQVTFEKVSGVTLEDEQAIPLKN